MFRALSFHDLAAAPDLSASMFADRTQQFVVRHHWPLRVDSRGWEVDEFDDDATTYCVVESAGRHRASLRLRAATSGSMLERHFPPLWRAASEPMRLGVEVTRFCAAPSLVGEARIAAVSDLLLGLCRHCQKVGSPAVFGVVYPSVARAITQAGWPARIAAEAIDGRGALLLAQWVASSQVAWTIQERRELREESLRDRRTIHPERSVA